MTTQQAIAYYGSQTRLADALGIAQSTVAEWGEYPPGLRQIQLERITRARLRAEKNVFEKKPRRRKAA